MDCNSQSDVDIHFGEAHHQGMDDYFHRLTDEFQRLSADDARLGAEEESIRKQRTDIRARLAVLTAGIDLYNELMEVQVKSERNGTPTFFAVPITPAMRTTADMAAEILRENDGPMKVRAILDKLVERGKLKGTRSDYGTVFGTLSRNGNRFQKTGEGEFDLAKR